MTHKKGEKGEKVMIWFSNVRTVYVMIHMSVRDLKRNDSEK